MKIERARQHEVNKTFVLRDLTHVRIFTSDDQHGEQFWRDSRVYDSFLFIYNFFDGSHIRKYFRFRCHE